MTFFPDEETATRSAEAVAQVQQSLGDEFGVVENEVIQGRVLVSRASEPVLRAVDPADTAGRFQPLAGLSRSSP